MNKKFEWLTLLVCAAVLAVIMINNTKSVNSYTIKQITYSNSMIKNTLGVRTNP